MAHHRGLTVDLIAEAGQQLGLAELSLTKVAKHLGVTTPALYRHVANRAELEELVAARILSSVSVDIPCPSTRSYLIALSQALFRACIAHPGLGAYMLLRFPADPQSQRIEQEARACLVAHGYSEQAAQILASVTATYAISLTASHELVDGAARQQADGAVARDAAANGTAEGEPGATGVLPGDTPQEGEGSADPLHAVTPEQRFTLFVLPAIDGLLSLVEPEDTLDDVITTAKGRLI